VRTTYVILKFLTSPLTDSNANIGKLVVRRCVWVPMTEPFLVHGDFKILVSSSLSFLAICHLEFTLRIESVGTDVLFHYVAVGWPNCLD